MSISDEEKLAQSYELLEETIKEIVSLEGNSGLLTDWCVVAAVQGYDEDGTGTSRLALLLPEGGGRVPQYRVHGLLDFMLSSLRNEANNIIHIVFDDEDEEDEEE